MDLFFMILMTIMVPVWYIWPSRIISMTYKAFSKSITIKNAELAEVLIAEKNTWGNEIAADPNKRNKMSLWGIIGYMLLLPQIVFLLYNWRDYIQTGSGQWCEAEQSYCWSAMLYYIIALHIKRKEATKFNKGEMW